MHKKLCNFALVWSMESADLIKKTVDRMKTQSVTQAQLAMHCGLSQAHLSKVLNKKTKLAGKTQAKLLEWIDKGEPKADRELDAIVRALEARLKSVDAKDRMQIMQFLAAVVLFMDHQRR
jgi:transcriptional regulator with XRE-family HTH domain